MKSIIIAALGMAFLPHTAFAQSAASQDAVVAYAVNQRQAISVTAIEHAHLMTEMNDFMKAVHGINLALSSKDFAAVSSIAQAMGPKGGKHDAVGKAVHDKMPKEWFASARPTHHGFLAVSQEASNPGATVESVMSKLAQTTQHCVNCHATFKLVIDAAPPLGR